MVLPDAKIRWRYVWVGAIITTILFLLGKYLIGIYLNTSNFTESYGAAGSLVALLAWVYYSVLYPVVWCRIYLRIHQASWSGHYQTVGSGGSRTKSRKSNRKGIPQAEYG